MDPLGFKCSEVRLGMSVKSSSGAGDGLEGGASLPHTPPLGIYETKMAARAVKRSILTILRKNSGL